MVVRSKAWNCGRSLGGTEVSNLAGGMDVVCCRVEVSARGRLLVRRSFTECSVSECDLET